MSNKPWKRKLESRIKKYLMGYSGCHDFYHAERTKNYALEIAKRIKCDKDVVYAGALLHDVGYKGKEKDDKNHNLHGMKVAEEWLVHLEFPKEKIKEVLESIRLHDNFSWGDDHEATEHVETKIIQDADRIDALGAIGVARIAYYFGERSYPIYNPAPVRDINKVWYNHSLLDQIRRDPMKKWENLNFQYSKILSNKKYKLLKRFYKDLKQELEDAHLK